MNVNDILVSIIIPVYNTAKYLSRCATHLCNQTIDEIELIFINDGSNDNSLDILNEFKEKYPDRVKIINKENGGQASARNLGIHLASGDYIGFADSDDYVEEDMFETMYNAAITYDANYVECNFKFIEDRDGVYKDLPKRGNVRTYTTNRDMFINPQVSPWNKLYKASILKDNPIIFPEGLIYEDTAFFIKSIPYISKTVYIAREFVHYFLRTGSTMNSTSIDSQHKVGNIIPVLSDILTYYKEHNLYAEYEKELEYFISKILLCSNISRIGRVTDKTLKAELIRNTFEALHEWFPNYKKNPYYHGKIKIYINLINPWNAGLISIPLGKIMRG